MTTYEVYDLRTGDTMAGPYQSIRRARRKADELDLVYGAIRYGVRVNLQPQEAKS